MRRRLVRSGPDRTTLEQEENLTIPVFHVVGREVGLEPACVRDHLLARISVRVLNWKGLFPRFRGLVERVPVQVRDDVVGHDI